MPSHRLAGFLRPFAGALLLAACGTTGPSESAAPWPLTIDLDRLPNYGSPTVPLHYVGVLGGPQDGALLRPVTDAGATLGRVLFFDRSLSINRSTSCASCHLQANGFVDADQFSVGFDGVRRTTVHAMRLANVRFAPGALFWDRRAPTLEALATQPIRHPVEMGFVTEGIGGLDSLVRRLRALPYYQALFQRAWGDSTITVPRIEDALAQYLRSLVSTGSRWDEGFAQVVGPDRQQSLLVPIPSFTAEENRGRHLYFTPPQAGGAGCGACHIAPTFALDRIVGGNGLDAGQAQAFKPPSLKNVAVTGPYMHDGRFATLEEVVDHYDRGVQPGVALDQRLRGPTGQPLRLDLSPADRQALVAFLRTLTDDAMLRDPKFSDPFRR